ncbi:MAG: FIST C-terminal domain-containing protein [Chitinophagaceae bacterium]|nr:FIST C-terminal domain-containing protein [Chitinophagaceae bacterium]
MQTAIYRYRDQQFIPHVISEPVQEDKAQLVLCFGAKNEIASSGLYGRLKNRFPAAIIACCSTSGEICHTEVIEDSITLTVIQFDDTSLKSHAVNIANFKNSYDAGEALIRKFEPGDISYVLVLSDGSRVNGSELVRGMNEVSENRLLITGGLAGDGNNFQSTLVGLNDNPGEGVIAAIGFYGKKLQVTHGSRGGWDVFGLEKTVTRSTGNVLFEIDNYSSLALYKQYLGPEAEYLPGSALMFPLSVRLPGHKESVVRTILSIDEKTGSMIFAGDIPQGSRIRFMRANFDKLTNAASEAANYSKQFGSKPPVFALLISCVGRKLVLQSRTEEEVEAVDEVFGCKTILSGFYSYGEISPIAAGEGCQLHNQTMTITAFYEN